MAITTAMCTSFKVELMQAEHDLTGSTGDTIQIALFKETVTGTYGAATTAYSDMTGNSDETSGTGYTAKGVTLTNVTPTSSGTTAFWDFSNDPQWTSASFSTDGAMIFNDTHASDAAISVHDFGGTQTVASGTFTIQAPAADASNAIIRL